MMRSFSKKQMILFALSEWFYIGGTAVSAFLGWINSVEGDEKWLAKRPVLWNVIQYLQESSFYVYLIVGGLVVLSFIYRKLGDPWVLEKLKFILDEYQYQVFHANGAPQDHDRVTIFQHKKNCLFVRHWSAKWWFMPWGNKSIFSDYLIPVLRSGHISQKTRAIFYAPDESDRAEGVAARAWASNRAIVLNDLPVMRSQAPQRDIKSYAESTFCDVGMINKYISEGRQMPRSIAAIPIESGGVVWGVVVLDSRSPQGVTDESVQHYQLTVALIGQLLERT
jgi:hypothetical protein